MKELVNKKEEEKEEVGAEEKAEEREIGEGEGEEDEDEDEESPPSLEWSHNVTCERCLLSHNDER